MPTDRITSDQAARRVVALFDTPVLPTLTETDTVGEWLHKAFADEHRLSSGEKVLLGVVQAIWNGGGDTRIADLLGVDDRCRAVILDTLNAVWIHL